MYRGFLYIYSMNLLQKLQRLSNNIITSFGHWNQPCTLIIGCDEYEVQCKYNRHHTSYNEIGEIKNAVNATVEFHAHNLADNGVPFLNADGKVVLANAKIRVTDVMATREYEIQSVRPDEQMGIIVCILTLKNNNYVPEQRDEEL